MREHELDARGLSCPLPVLKARKLIKGLAPGARLRVLATDPRARADFTQFCETTGHRLINVEEEADRLVILLEKHG